MTLAEKLSYLASQRGEDEAALLARAVDAGVEALYREALIEAYLEGGCSREELVREFGLAAAAEVDERREAFERDVLWGRSGG